MSTSCLSGIWNQLKKFDQFTCWDRKYDKAPLSPHWRDHHHGSPKASTTNPDTWGSFTEAVKAYLANDWDGIGFVLTAEDPIGCVDWDCALTEDGNLADWMPDFTPFEGAFNEISPSGRGLHTWGIFEEPERDEAELITLDQHVDDEHREIRILDESCYVRLTGWVFGSRNVDAPAIDLDEWVSTVDDDIARFEVTAGGSPPPDAVDESPENELGITIYDIIAEGEAPPGKRVPNPWHDSTTGRNFQVFADSGGEVAWCYRCRTDITPTHALLMEYDIIPPSADRCTRAQNATSRDVYEACEAGRADGLPIPEPDGYRKRSRPNRGLAGKKWEDSDDT